METSHFVFQGKNREVKNADYVWESPSNIALIKYWGKRGDQIPANPSLSFTLNNCRTRTRVEFTKRNGEKRQLRFFFEGKENPAFGKKSFDFFEKIRGFQPFLRDYHISVRTENTFPHSSGIASSASGMSALALCCMSLERELSGNMKVDHFYKKASFLARQGSGSASRSIYGGLVTWGKHPDIPGSSDLYASPYRGEVHNSFSNYKDIVLLIHKGGKTVSSTAGHSALTENPFAQVRFDTAFQHLSTLKSILKNGDLEEFTQLIELEALTLHALMMTGKKPFILMKPQTLSVIKRIREFRAETKIPVCFTLDAGANVHFLFPGEFEKGVMNFIESELVVYCENKQYICDAVGSGPEFFEA